MVDLSSVIVICSCQNNVYHSMKETVDVADVFESQSYMNVYIHRTSRCGLMM